MSLRVTRCEQSISAFRMILSVYSVVLSPPMLIAVFGTIVISILFYVKTWTQRSPGIPKLHFKDSALASHLLKRCRLLNRSFDPPWWLRNAHVQTILPHIVSVNAVEFDREYLQMKDRGVIALDWVTQLSVHKRKRCTILLILPGLTANAVSVSNMCSLAAHKGFRPVVYNFRGFGNSVLTTPKILSTGDPTDLRQVVKYLHVRFPKSLVTILAYGSGCSLLLSYLGEFGSSANICVGACISPCFDDSERFSKGVNGIYDLMYLIKIKLSLSSHSNSLAKYINYNDMLKAWSFEQFDEAVFSRLYNFTNIIDFWDKNHPLRDVDEISVPLLFLNSLDDPFYSKLKIPYDLCQYYPHFLMVATNKGGHCGFMDKICEVSWAERLSLDYIDSVLEFTNKGHSINYGKSRVRSTI